LAPISWTSIAIDAELMLLAFPWQQNLSATGSDDGQSVGSPVLVMLAGLNPGAGFYDAPNINVGRINPR
jgi:hypothetical protein